MPKNQDPCKPFACRIQACLEAKKFNFAACENIIEEMRNCCRKWGKKSFVCEGMNVDKPQKDYKV